MEFGEFVYLKFLMYYQSSREKNNFETYNFTKWNISTFITQWLL